MWIWQDKDWISRNDYWTWEDIHGSRKTSRNTRLACPNYCQRNQEIPRFWEFLQTIYPRLLTTWQPNEWFAKERPPIFLDRRLPTSFWHPKKKFTEEPVLTMPDHTKPFQIETDTSKYATGAVLTQLDGNGDRHPISFTSKTFSPPELNYDIYDQELLAIIWELDEWRHYIHGSPRTTTILLLSQEPHLLLGSKELTQWQAQWSLYLLEFDIKLVHTPGTKKILSDALSRWPDFCPDEYHDNEDIVMLPDHMFLQLIDLDLQQKIVLSDSLDQQALDTLTFLLNDSLTVPLPLKQDLKDWTVHTDNNHQYLFYQGRAYIPQNDNLRQDIVRNFHDHITAGHPRELGTYNTIWQHYWWPGLRMFVKNYVQGCGLCQQFKIDRSPMKPALLPTEGAHVPRPFAYCSIDLITDLPLVDGFDSILVVVDQGLSKGVNLIPCTKTLTSEDMAQLLLDNLYKRFRLPDKIISDQGPQFASKAFTELLKLLGIKSALSTAYHPQPTELLNKPIRKLKPTYPYIVHLNLKNGHELCQHLNSHITIGNMLTKPKLCLNSCSENPQSPYHFRSNQPSILQWQSNQDPTTKLRRSTSHLWTCKKPHD